MSRSLWVITYDIGQQRRWRKVFKLLKSYGVSTQLSVFECRMTTRQQQDLWQAMENIIHPVEDRVHGYMVCASCDHKAKVLGYGRRSEDLPLVWVVSDA